MNHSANVTTPAASVTEAALPPDIFVLPVARQRVLSASFSFILAPKVAVLQSTTTLYIIATDEMTTVCVHSRRRCRRGVVSTETILLHQAYQRAILRLQKDLLLNRGSHGLAQISRDRTSCHSVCPRPV